MTMERKHVMENKIVGRKEEDFPRLMENKMSRVHTLHWAW